MLQMGCGMEGYMVLKLDWKGNLEAITAAADGAGGVGVDGEWRGREPLPDDEIPPPLLLFAGVTEPLDIPCPPVWSVVMLPPLPLEGVTLCEPVLSCWDKTVLPLLLPGSRFWLRSFSSRRHLARRFENQT
jgi:hypothetical protein